MIVYDEPQDSPMWRARRVGMLTASKLDKLLTAAKLAPSKQADALLDTLAAEWILGQPLDNWQGSFWTERGTAMQPEARCAFAVATGLDCREVGFITPAEGRLVGASPDSLVYADEEPAGVLELKCPRLDTHLGYWRAREAGAPTAYRLQIQGQIWVTGLACGWFQSYHPDGPEVLHDVPPDDDVQDALSEHVPAFEARLRAYRDELLEAGCQPADPWDWAAEQEEMS